MQSQLNYRGLLQFMVSFLAQDFLYSAAPSAAVNWPEKLLIVVLTACSQTGHCTPQPSTEWVCVGGSV